MNVYIDAHEQMDCSLETLIYFIKKIQLNNNYEVRSLIKRGITNELI